MEATRIDTFKELAPKLFQVLVDDFGYILEETKISRHWDQDWSVHLIYINKERNLKIVVMQEPYYTDYGFSFFIYNTNNDEYNILYNVAHEDQDEENSFLIKAREDLFSTSESLDMISGKSWKKLDKILFRKIQ